MSDYNTNTDQTKEYDATITTPESVYGPSGDFASWFLLNSHSST